MKERLTAELRGSIKAAMVYDAQGKHWLAEQARKQARELSAQLVELGAV